MPPSPGAYEKLGSFYLGREYNMQDGEQREDLLLYDSKDLTTHAVCVGMTGSGKTGLCVGLLEEAAIDGIPALVIDPKGDLTNLLLTFPQLRPADFEPWVNADDARRQSCTVPQYAGKQAALWKKGLADWGQDGERIDKLRQAADFAIYTPGSEAGRPLSVLSSFAAPPAAVIDDAELLREQVGTAVAGLLGLVGIDADPVRSREHILLSTIVGQVWGRGEDLDLGQLIQLVQTPPVSRIGMLDLDSFYPAKERFELALALNNVLAAPSFASWRQGEPLDIQNLLYTPQGKPRVSVVYIAHLPERERMFVVTLLLNQMLGWMRTRSGTTSLRALLYMDEIFGYMPPVAEPPSKRPLLTLLKQGRAFGVGAVLATQNPVDLDYKGLSNAGTWFLGRLQTDRDKQRVLDGLEGVSATGSGEFDRQRTEAVLAGLGKRVFMMHNVHENNPVVFHTRWVMSYLRGPLTRTQIKTLTPDTDDASTHAAPSPSAPSPAQPRADKPGARTAPPPVLPPEIRQTWMPLGRQPLGGEIHYRPQLLGLARLHFSDRGKKLEATRKMALLTTVDPDAALTVDWDGAEAIEFAADALLTSPPVPGRHEDLPAPAAKTRSYATWKRALTAWLYHNARFELHSSPALKQYSRPGESEADFRIRLTEHAREARDAAVDKLRRRYASKFKTLRDRIQRAELTVSREREQARGASVSTVISVGATLLSAMLGRKAISATTLGKATTAARGAGRAATQAQDVGRAKIKLEGYRQQLAELESQFESDVLDIQNDLDPNLLEFDAVSLKPLKRDIDVQLLALAWVPFERSGDGTSSRLS